jgi:thioesterase domain-containing protein
VSDTQSPQGGVPGDASDERKRLSELLAERERAKGGAQGGGGAGSQGGAPDPSTPGSSDTASDWSPLVPIQPLGSKPPFFIVHAILGSVFPYHRLAIALGADRPVYGLQARGLEGRHPPVETIPEMAALYVEAVRSVQPGGPYHLGGYSMGGWIAFEMARLLRAASEDVSVLAQLGTPAPFNANVPGGEAVRWGVRYAEDVFSLWRNSALADSPDLQNAFFAQQGFPNPFGANPSFAQQGSANPFGSTTGAGAGAGGTAGAGTPGGPSFGAAWSQAGPAYRVALTNAAAQARYIAEPAELGADVFLTTEQSALYQSDPTMGWGGLCSGEVAAYHVGGNHLNMFQEPQVLRLAELLSQRLDYINPVGGQP